MGKAQIKNNALIVALSLCAIFFILYPMYSLVYKGPFSWHVQQKAFTNGIIEALCLFIFILSGLRASSYALRITLLAFPIFYYARRFGIDISIIVIYIYIQGIFSLGWRSIGLLGIEKNESRYGLIASGVCGISIWSALIWILATIGYHTFSTLQIALALLILFFIFFFKSPQLAVIFYKSATSATNKEKTVYAAYMASFLVLFAKCASSPPGSDSLWYGLTLKNVLFGDSGIYSDNRLVAFVHYYPKLYEALLVPLSELGSLSLPTGLAIYAATLVGFSVYAILVEEGREKSISLLISLFAFSTPALGSIALSTKGDTFAAWMGLSAVFFLFRLRSEPTFASFWLGSTAAMFSVLSRLSFLPYLPIFVAFFIFYFFKGNLHKAHAKLSARACIVPVITCLVVFLVILRTYLLTGVLCVVPAELVDLQAKAGLILKYPVGLIRPPAGDSAHLAHILWSYLFEISNFSRTLFVWTGNHWLFAAILFLLHRKQWGNIQKQHLVFLSTLSIAFLMLMFGVNYRNVGPDGNYFIFPICCIILLSALSFEDELSRRTNFARKIVACFIVCNLLIVFFTSLWRPGTRAFDLDFTRLPLEYDNYISNNVRQHKIERLYSFFVNADPGSKAVGLETFNRKKQLRFYLPVCYEPFRTISGMNRSIISSKENVIEFIEKTKVDYIVISEIAAAESENTNIVSAVSFLQQKDVFQMVFKEGEYLLLKRRSPGTFLDHINEAQASTKVE